jgi:hypothetical protein
MEELYNVGFTYIYIFVCVCVRARACVRASVRPTGINSFCDVCKVF